MVFNRKNTLKILTFRFRLYAMNDQITIATLKVLIIGESGVGKSRCAYFIFNLMF